MTGYQRWSEDVSGRRHRRGGGQNNPLVRMRAALLGDHGRMQDRR
jgi:hypothetical protein